MKKKKGMEVIGEMDKGIVDEIIRRLWEAKGGGNRQIQLSESEVRQLCISSRQIFLSQPILLHLEAPIKVCGTLSLSLFSPLSLSKFPAFLVMSFSLSLLGDIHGQYQDLLRLFEHGGHPPSSSYLFLGDYVDRGKQSLETICLLLAYKIRYPDKIFLLRGNHEDAKINRIYGFYDECKRRFNVRLWKTFTDCFNCLPVAAIIDRKIMCMHGGLSPELNDLNQIKEISRPTDVPDSGLLCDLLWSDPSPAVTGWADSDRGISSIFGADRVFEFLKKNDLDLICRGHQVMSKIVKYQVAK